MMFNTSRSATSRANNTGSRERQSHITSSSLAQVNPRNTFASPQSFYSSPRPSYGTPAPCRDRTNLQVASLQARSSGDPNLESCVYNGYNFGSEELTWSPEDMQNWPQYHSRGGPLDMLQQLEERIELKFNDFSTRLENIESKFGLLESVANNHAHSSSLSSSSGSDSSLASGHRKKRSPPDLQHKIRSVHSSLNEENQLKCHERIDSEHNRKVVANIVKELLPQGSQQSGKIYSSEQIRDGCRIYRKSLHEADKEKSEAQRRKMRIRSRQQRLFDRRNKAVNKEKFKNVKKYWEEITPDMMTEEETGEDDNYIRRRQSWRSTNFNRLIDALDASCTMTKSMAKPRQIGAPTVNPPPSSAKKWMVSVQNTDQDEEQDEEDDIETFAALADS